MSMLDDVEKRPRAAKLDWGAEGFIRLPP